MSNQSTSDELGTKLIKALGLPENVERLEFVFKAGHPIRVICESYIDKLPDNTDQFVTQLSEYELHKVESQTA
jgi:hypothetical protein